MLSWFRPAGATSVVLAALLSPFAGAAARPIGPGYLGPLPAASLIKDGGFEQPPAPTGGFLVFNTGQTFSHWAVVGASGNIGIVSGTFTQNGFRFPARFGKQWLDLTGLSQSATGIQQIVNTISGRQYTLTFWIGNTYDPGGIFGTTSTVNVFVNGSQTFSATNSRRQRGMAQVWQKFQTTIMATSNRTMIAFINGDPANDTQNGLDGVSLVPAAFAASGEDFGSS